MPDDTETNGERHQLLDTFETTMRQYACVYKKQSRMRIPYEGRAI